MLARVDELVSAALSTVSETDAAARILETTVRRYLDRPAGLVRPLLLLTAVRAWSAPASSGGAPEHVERSHGASVASSPRALAASSPDASAVTIAAATEVLHVYALIHDDLLDEPMDDETVRTLLLAGDLLQAVGYGAIAREVRRGVLEPSILETVERTAIRTVVGQAREVGAHAAPADFEHLYRLYDAKTGVYTVAAPLEIGALTAGAGEIVLPEIRRIARPLGRAFQLLDDLEDVERALKTGARRWERNLLETWRATRTANTGGDGDPPAREHPVTPEEIRQLRSDIARRAAELIREARTVAEALPLPPAARRWFVDRVIFLVCSRGHQGHTADGATVCRHER